MRRKNIKKVRNESALLMAGAVVILSSCCTAVNLDDDKYIKEVNVATEEQNTQANNPTGTELSAESLAEIHNAMKICTLSDYKSSKYEAKEVPACDTWFKSYMSYKAITNTSSDQYKIQQKAWTDENGLRRYNNDYVVAMGTYYSDRCYTRFKVEFDSGNEITVIVGDIKQDIHTDGKNQYSAVYDSNNKFISANVLEFIVDASTLSKKAKNLGSVHCIEGLEGNIVSIKRIKPEAESKA